MRRSRSGVAVRPWSRARIARLRNLHLLAQRVFQLLANVRVFLQENSRILAALAHAFAAKAEPRSCFFNQPLVHAEINQIALAGNSFAVQNIELRLAERRRHFVLHHFAARPRTHHFVAFLDRLHAPDVHAHRRIKLERAPARGGLWIAEHHANLFANLVDENQAGARLRNNGRQLPQSLRHQPRLQTHLRLAHFTFEFRLRHQRRHRIHHHDVHAARADQRFRNFQRLLSVIRLRHQQVVHVHAQFPRVHRIERVLRVNERRLPAELLRFGDHVQRQRRFAAGLRPINFDDAPAREAAHAQRRVQRQASAGNYADRH